MSVYWVELMAATIQWEEVEASSSHHIEIQIWKKPMKCMMELMSTLKTSLLMKENLENIL